eukprot:5026169-Prymnesium_polylepis.1
MVAQFRNVTIVTDDWQLSAFKRKPSVLAALQRSKSKGALALSRRSQQRAKSDDPQPESTQPAVEMIAAGGDEMAPSGDEVAAGRGDTAAGGGVLASGSNEAAAGSDETEVGATAAVSTGSEPFTLRRIGVDAQSSQQAPTHFLLYLNRQTFSDEALAREVSAAWERGLPIAMAHENDVAHGGCPFSLFFETVSLPGHPLRIPDRDRLQEPFCFARASLQPTCTGHGHRRPSISSRAACSSRWPSPSWATVSIAS